MIPNQKLYSETRFYNLFHSSVWPDEHVIFQHQKSLQLKSYKCCLSDCLWYNLEKRKQRLKWISFFTKYEYSKCLKSGQSGNSICLKTGQIGPKSQSILFKKIMLKNGHSDVWFLDISKSRMFIFSDIYCIWSEWAGLFFAPSR